MGVVQSKKKEVKAYASKYTTSILQNNSTSSTSTQHNQSHGSTSSNKKYMEYDDNLKHSTSIYSADGVSRSNTPTASTSPVLAHTNKNKGVVSPSKNSTSLNSDNYFDEPISFQSIHQSDSFFLPKDWDLKEYQYHNHFALKTLHGGNVTPAVAPKLKKGARVIQLGTCSGPWIMDMAPQYPECNFTAIEVISGSLETLPSLPNVKLVRDKPYYEGFDIPDNSIDYIHLRSMGLTIGLDKWPMLFKEMRRVLKPDGVIRLEEISHSPKGTVMIESFIETLRTILAENNQDYDIAAKYGTILPQNGFQVIESRKKTVHYGDGKLAEDLAISILNAFEELGTVLAPRLGLEVEDYIHRIEMIMAQCVQINAAISWYSWVAKKAPSSSTSTTTNNSSS